MSSSATTGVIPHDALVTQTHAPSEPGSASPAANTTPEGIAWMQAILDEFEGPLLRYAQRITGNLELAREVVQEIFLQICREDRSALEGHLARWLFHVCRNRALDVQRKEHRMSVATDLDLRSVPAEAEQPHQIEVHETSSQLLLLLERLPTNQQEVIRLKFQGGLKYREIAEVTGLSVSNVGVLLHTGLKRLRALMKDGS